MLSEADMERAARIAHARNSGKLDGTSRRHKDSPFTDYDLHWIGVRAEIAVCKRFKFPIDERVYLEGDKGKPDMYVGELRCEIKSSGSKPPIIKLGSVDEFKSDILIICHVDTKIPSRVEIWGYVTRVQFIEQHEVEEFGYGPKVVMRPKDYMPHQELDGYVTVAFPMA